MLHLPAKEVVGGAHILHEAISIFQNVYPALGRDVTAKFMGDTILDDVFGPRGLWSRSDK